MLQYDMATRDVRKASPEVIHELRRRAVEHLRSEMQYRLE
jgi:hypothetical protein